MTNKITYVIKRSGAIVPFNQERIANAIYRGVVAVGGRDKETANALSIQVVEILNQKFSAETNPHIEDIQDVVEKVLIENGHAQVAKELPKNTFSTGMKQQKEEKLRHAIIQNKMKIFPGQKFGEILIGLYPITFTPLRH